MSKKNLTPSVAEPTLETRRDVMKLSLAVAAFGAAMGIAGPSSVASEGRHRGPKGGGIDKELVGRTKGPKIKVKEVSTRTGRPKIKTKTPTND